MLPELSIIAFGSMRVGGGATVSFVRSPIVAYTATAEAMPITATPMRAVFCQGIELRIAGVSRLVLWSPKIGNRQLQVTFTVPGVLFEGEREIDRRAMFGDEVLALRR